MPLILGKLIFSMVNQKKHNLGGSKITFKNGDI